MKTYTTIKTLVFSAIVAMTFNSCVKDDDWNTPEILCNNRFDAPTIKMADFVALAPPAPNSTTYNGSSTYKVPVDGAPVIFDAYVVSSDENGNFYKTISFQDSPSNPTVGMSMEVDKSSNYADFPVGAHIRIKANGLVLGLDRGTIKIGSIDPTYAIGRIPSILLPRYLAGVCNGENGLDIATLVPTVLGSIDEAKATKYINTLVKVQNVQFDDTEVLPTPKTFISYIANTGQDTDRTIIDITGASSVIRNSGYATFGAETLPTKSGDLTFVVSKYNANWQMLIRGLNDIDFQKDRINFIINEGFTNFTANDWTAYSVAGSQVWSIATFGNPAPSALMNGYGGVNEDWLISKSIPLTGFTNAILSFQTDGRFQGNPLEVYITTDTYTGGNPNNLNWVKLSAKLDTDLNAFAGFVSSGGISLSDYLNKNVRIALKYTNASTTAATSWEVDNFRIGVIK